MEKLKKQKEEFNRFLEGVIVMVGVIILLILVIEREFPAGTWRSWWVGFLIGAFVAGVVAGGPGKGTLAGTLMALAIPFYWLI